MRAPSLLALSCGLLTGCQGGVTSPRFCLDVESPAVEVEVRDARSGRPAAGGARGWVRAGAFHDSLRVVGWTGPQIADSTAHRMAAAHERPGTYTVQITRPGYQVWRVDGVRAEKTECGVSTAKLRAELVPEAGP